MLDESVHEVTPEAISRFLDGNASGEEKAVVVSHLLSQCPTCLAHFVAAAGTPRLGSFGLAGNDPIAATVSPSDTYEEAFAAAKRTLLQEVERRTLSHNTLLAELHGLPPSEQEMKVRNSRRYASPALALALAELSHDKRHDDPAAMLHYARLAVAVAEGATPENAVGRALLADCRARAWGQLANAHRVKSQIPEAETAIGTAERHLEAGSGDLALRARLLSQKASLRTYQRRFAEAAANLAEVSTLRRELHDRTGEAEALVQLGGCRVIAGAPAEALQPLNRVLALIDDATSDLRRAALLNLGWAYTDLRRPFEAHALLPSIEEHFATCTDRVNRLRLLWLKGVVERDLGLVLSAAHRLMFARAGFIERDLCFESALVSLDLTEVYIYLQRTRDALRTVGEAIPILQGLGVERDLLGALLKLREIVAERQEAVALLRQVATAVKTGAAQASP